MKTRNLLFGAMGLLLMASCAKDDVERVNRDGDEIAFNVASNASTRVNSQQGVFCNNNLPAAFYVWATHEGQPYIKGDKIERREKDLSGIRTNYWENLSGTRYWPEGNVKFYAFVNDGSNQFTWNNVAPTIANYEVSTKLDEQYDVIYAVKTASKDDGVVSFNFRHALSQIVFRAENPNENLHVRISGVSICKVGNRNTFTFPTNDTDDNIVIGHVTGNNPNSTNNDSWGEWVQLTGGETTYSVNFTPVNLPGGTEAPLTDTNEPGKEYSNNALLLLPQKTTAWKTELTLDPGGPGPDHTEGRAPAIELPTGNPANQNGTYFLIKCIIWNVAGTELDENSDVCLWGNKEGDGTYTAKDIAIPVALDWKQGKKYIYTFIFNGGGFDPNPDPYNPTPIMKTITFTATVDDFESVEKETIIPEGPVQRT